MTLLSGTFDQYLSSDIRNDFEKNAPFLRHNSESWNLPNSSVTTVSLTLSDEVGFVEFDLAGSRGFNYVGNVSKDGIMDGHHRVEYHFLRSESRSFLLTVSVRTF